MKKYVDTETVKKFVKETMGIDGIAYMAFERWINSVPGMADPDFVQKEREKLKLGDLMSPRKGLFTDEILLYGRVIAYGAGSGKVLFDTKKNKREYIRSFMEREVVNIWAGIKADENTFHEGADAVTKIYLSERAINE